MFLRNISLLLLLPIFALIATGCATVGEKAEDRSPTEDQPSSAQAQPSSAQTAGPDSEQLDELRYIDRVTRHPQYGFYRVLFPDQPSSQLHAEQLIEQFQSFPLRTYIFVEGAHAGESDMLGVVLRQGNENFLLLHPAFYLPVDEALAGNNYPADVLEKAQKTGYSIRHLPTLLNIAENRRRQLGALNSGEVAIYERYKDRLPTFIQIK